MKQSAVEWLFNELWETPKDKLTWHSILNKAKEMESSQEMSDEEIEKFVEEEMCDITTDFDFGVIQGMKWYREQLKKL